LICNEPQSLCRQVAILMASVIGRDPLKCWSDCWVWLAQVNFFKLNLYSIMMGVYHTIYILIYNSASDYLYYICEMSVDD